MSDSTPSALSPVQAARLAAGLQALDLPASLHAPLSRYLLLLHRWNQVYNLTAVRDINEMITVHLLDSLAVVPHMQATQLLDVGSGAGLPGIPLAIACSGLEVTLLDSNSKKVRFLRQAVIHLGLGSRVSVVKARIEAYHPAQPFDGVISRAFADPAQYVRLAGHVCAPAGHLLAMLGRLATPPPMLPPGWQITRTWPLNVPMLDAQRHLLHIERI